jgi:hypothetical protein
MNYLQLVSGCNKIYKLKNETRKNKIGYFSSSRKNCGIQNRMEQTLEIMNKSFFTSHAFIYNLIP